MKGKTNCIYRVLEIFFGAGEVQLPPRASGAVLAQGTDAVRCRIDENRRREEVRRCAENAQKSPYGKECGRDIRFSISTGARYSVQMIAGRRDRSSAPNERIPATPDSANVALDSRLRRPPDLHAPVLSFSARLVKYVRERCDGRAPRAYKRAGIDRKLYSKIVSSDRATVSKLTALQFAIGLQLSLDETEAFLKSAGYALSPTIPQDCAFAFCIEHRVWNILDVNSILVGAGLPGLDVRF